MASRHVASPGFIGIHVLLSGVGGICGRIDVSRYTGVAFCAASQALADHQPIGQSIARPRSIDMPVIVFETPTDACSPPPDNTPAEAWVFNSGLFMSSAALAPTAPPRMRPRACPRACPRTRPGTAADDVPRSAPKSVPKSVWDPPKGCATNGAPDSMVGSVLGGRPRVPRRARRSAARPEGPAERPSPCRPYAFSRGWAPSSCRASCVIDMSRLAARETSRRMWRHGARCLRPMLRRLLVAGRQGGAEADVRRQRLVSRLVGVAPHSDHACSMAVSPL